MKKKIISFSLIVFLVLVAIFTYMIKEKWNNQRKQVLARCVLYDNKFENMLDCYGVLSIWNWENGDYAVINNFQGTSPIAFIKSPNDFYVLENEMYLINQSTGICGDGLDTHKYCVDFQVAGKHKRFDYDNAQDVPHYLIINTKTGDEKFYLTLDQSSTNERQAFQKLIK
jgi:hypothetical protein